MENAVRVFVQQRSPFQEEKWTLRVHALFLNDHCLSVAVRNLFLKALLGRLFHSVLFTLDVTNCVPTASVWDPNVLKVDIFFLLRSEL